MPTISERLRNWCIDWNGKLMVRGEAPRDGLHCNDLIDAADTIDALVAALVVSKSAIMKGCDTVEAINEIDAALALARKGGG